MQVGLHIIRNPNILAPVVRYLDTPTGALCCCFSALAGRPYPRPGLLLTLFLHVPAVHTPSQALYDGQLIDAYFTRSFYKHLLGAPLTHVDLEAVDPDYYKALAWMLHNDITDVLDLTFTAETDFFGRKVRRTRSCSSAAHPCALQYSRATSPVECRRVPSRRLDMRRVYIPITVFLSLAWIQTGSITVAVWLPQELVELVPGGKDMRVTESNKREYVNLVARHRMTTSITQQINAFLEGFWQLVPRHLIAIFNDHELELLIRCVCVRVDVCGRACLSFQVCCPVAVRTSVIGMQCSARRPKSE